MKRIEVIPKLQKRQRDSHKGSFGKILIVGGSRGYIGAPALAANAALRSGAGLVTMAVPESVQPTIASLACCATSLPLPEDERGVISEKALPVLYDEVFKKGNFDVVAVGPGLGGSSAMVSFIVELNRRRVPCVIDADGLNRMAELNWFGLLTGSCVITPHPGELARLLRKTISEIQGDREGSAVRAAELMKKGAEGGDAVCLLKGYQTVVTDGETIYINPTGNPGMATGGSGDVLTGVIAALMGQKLSPFEAAALGSQLHGLAGDLAAEELGEISLIASDLLEYLPAAFRKSTQ
jgi:NAD(P)H-hydrate epimerase